MPEAKRSVEGLHIKLPTAIGIIVVILTSVVGATWSLSSAYGAIADNGEDIAANDKQIEKLETEYKQAIVDVKRGQKEGLDKIEEFSRKFDMLLFELKVREVVSETVAEPPP